MLGPPLLAAAATGQAYSSQPDHIIIIDKHPEEQRLEVFSFDRYRKQTLPCKLDEPATREPAGQ